jgi:histidine triad (HIT) family protein
LTPVRFMEKGAEVEPQESCPFCRIESKQSEVRTLYEDEEVLAFEDIHPQAPLHVLIVPRRHIGTLLNVREEDACLVGRMVLVANRIAREKKVDRSGFRLVINCNRNGGQTVGHLHLHLLGGRRMGWPPG